MSLKAEACSKCLIILKRLPPLKKLLTLGLCMKKKVNSNCQRVFDLLWWLWVFFLDVFEELKLGFTPQKFKNITIHYGKHGTQQQQILGFWHFEERSRWKVTVKGSNFPIIHELTRMVLFLADKICGSLKQKPQSTKGFYQEEKAMFSI